MAIILEREVSLTSVITSLLMENNAFDYLQSTTLEKYLLFVIPRTCPPSNCPFGMLLIPPRYISEKIASIVDYKCHKRRYHSSV